MMNTAVSGSRPRSGRERGLRDGGPELGVLATESAEALEESGKAAGRESHAGLGRWAFILKATGKYQSFVRGTRT